MKVNDKRGKDNEDYGLKSKKEGIPTVNIGESLKDVQEVPEPPIYSDITLHILQDRMLVQPFPKITQRGSIIIPDEADIPIDRGRVCDIGPDVKNVKVGDVILKIEGLGQTIKDGNGAEYMIVQEKAAIAIDKELSKNE